MRERKKERWGWEREDEGDRVGRRGREREGGRHEREGERKREKLVIKGEVEGEGERERLSSRLSQRGGEGGRGRRGGEGERGRGK